MKYPKCINIACTTPDGLIKRFYVPYTHKKQGLLSPKDFFKLRDKCLALDLKYPVPVGYSVH